VVVGIRASDALINGELFGIFVVSDPDIGITTLQILDCKCVVTQNPCNSEWITLILDALLNKGIGKFWR
jgi:hypothetical protein